MQLACPTVFDTIGLSGNSVAQGGVAAWNTQTNKIIEIVEAKAPSHVLTAAANENKIVIGGRLLFGQFEKTLVALDLNTGKRLWGAFPSAAVSAVTLSNNSAFAVGYNGVMAYDLTTGLVKAGWPTIGANPVADILTNEGPYPPSSISLSGNSLWVADGGFVRYDATSGKRLSEIRNGLRSFEVKTVVAAPKQTFVGGKFSLVDALDRYHYGAIDKESGQLLDWQLDGSINNLYPVSSTDLALVGSEIVTYRGGGFPVQFQLGTVDPDSGKFFPKDSLHIEMDQWPRYYEMAMAVHDNELYVSGTFSRIGQEERGGIARIDLAQSTISDWNPVAVDNLYYNSEQLLYSNNWIYAKQGRNVFKISTQNGSIAGNWSPSEFCHPQAQLSLFDGRIFCGGSHNSNARIVDAETAEVLATMPGARVFAAGEKSIIAGGNMLLHGPRKPGTALGVVDPLTGNISPISVGLDFVPRVMHRSSDLLFVSGSRDEHADDAVLRDNCLQMVKLGAGL